MPVGIGYGGKSKVGTMDKPTGPTGILASSRPRVKPGGTKHPGSAGKKGLVGVQMKKAIGGRR